MSEDTVQSFQKTIADGAVFGLFMKTSDPAFVEAAGYSGMDFVILDMEHGPANLTAMQHNVRAAQVSGVLPIIRVNQLSESAISQALDIGAAGVQIPQITTAEEASIAVKATKYYPDGERGVCRFVRSAHYSAIPREKYFSQANRSTIVIVQLEGQKAIHNLDEILNVPGIDIIFIGPYDLSQSLGMPGDTTHHKVVEQMREIVQKTERKGVVTGTFTDTPQTLEMWRQAGVKYLSYSVDVGLFYETCAGLVKQFRA